MAGGALRGCPQRVQAHLQKCLNNGYDISQMNSCLQLIEEVEANVFCNLNFDGMEKRAETDKIRAATYFMYCLMYEQVFHFNPVNHVTFAEITERVEKYGRDQMKNILQFYH